MSVAFSLLHSKVQKFIFKSGWKTFRPIQDDAIQILTQSKSHLLICAPTASGKTEAAFLPIISNITEDYSSSFRAIYISPLKALINDQFKRVNEMCKDIGIPVTKWHGDVAQNLKSKATQSPQGILLITPESLEAILINKGTLSRSIFKNLSWIVIDEIHSFVGTERGAQLKSLIARIEDSANVQTTKVGLSATIGNPEGVARWMSSSGEICIIQDDDWNDSGIEGIIRGFERKNPLLETTEPIDEVEEHLIESICDNFNLGKNLIFGNSKRKLEEVNHRVSKLTLDRMSPTSFLIHHGSLSKFTRENAETEIKESNQAVSVFCTSTLEMGVDIGSVEKIGIIDPPWSVSSFAQRLGRSGRREGTNKCFEFLIQQDEISKESRTSELLRERLIKSIAIVLLHLDHFKESLIPDRFHFSTLVHQTISLCIQKMGASFEEISEIIISKGFESLLSKNEIYLFLEHLISEKILFRDQAGIYLTGKVGDALSGGYEFYSVFQSSEQWTISHAGQQIGSIPIIGIYRAEDRLLLGGRVWTVIEVNESMKILTVKPAKNAKAPIFESSYGITDKIIHQKMKAIYESQNSFPFIDAVASRMLLESRENYKSLFPKNGIFSQTVPIFEGTVIQNTIKIIMTKMDLDFGISEITLETKDGYPGWLKDLEKNVNLYEDNLSLAKEMARDQKIIEKYDRYLSEDLLTRGYAQKYIDLEGAKNWLSKLKNTF